MSCGEAGKKRSLYTGNQVGWLNFVGDFNYVAGGPPGSGLAAGETVINFIPAPGNRRVWLRQDATLDDKLLDAAYPTINLQWFADIEWDAETVFRVSDRSFYIQDEDGTSRYYDARVERSPSITASVGEWLQQNYEVGDTSLVLNNRDGFYNDYLAMGPKYRQWTGVKVKIYIGFGEKRSNYLKLFDGQITDKQGLTATRDSIEIKCFDKFDLDEIPLPPRTFTSDDFPEIDSNFAGKYVPLVYGDWSENVPTYGSINATCTNALEADPTTYKFKISDVALESIDSVWLHRGERIADKPQGPIRIADNIIVRDLDGGEFEIPAAGVVLDEAYYIANRLKTGPGTSGQLLTSDNGFNYIEQGVKVGDTVIDGAASQAKVTLQNIEYKSTEIGAAGNGIGIEYYLLPASFVDTGGNSKNKCYASLVGSTIRVGITQYTDSTSAVHTGVKTANAIKDAINENPNTNALVRLSFVGSVPFGYPSGTKLGEVDQTIPAGPVTTTGGVDANFSAEITSVANFQITIDGSTSFSPGTEYSISTVQYKFMKSDKITVQCRGKNLNLVSLNRLSNYSTSIRKPNGLAMDFNSTYWICDDESQKVYNLDFDRSIKQAIPYSDIDPSITQLSGISIASDRTLWVTSPNQSTIYRYDLDLSELGITIHTSEIIGLAATLGNLSGISVQADNRFWIIDNSSRNMYLIDVFSGVQPNVVRTLNTSTADIRATDPLDIAYDDQNDELCFADRATNTLYRVDETTGELISSFEFADVDNDVGYVSGAAVCQDGTLMLVDRGTLNVYNYNPMVHASSNPACIARDILGKFGGHTFDEFDLSFMATARQLEEYRARLYLDKKSTMVKELNKLLTQFNTAFFLRFNKYALFFIHFDNFRATGKKVSEKDIKADSFKPGKEMNQYFNTANADFGYDPFKAKTQTSDTYVSTAAITFAGKEYPKTLSMPAVYRREDLDKLIPLHVRLAAPEPEFIDVTFGFRVIRSQMQDFLSLTFDDDVVPKPGLRSGRRFTNVPCMIRKLNFDLGPMTVTMKLWSLGGTAFNGYTPPGQAIGGANDPILLSSVGRQARISPTGIITGSTANSVTLENFLGMDAETRHNGGTIKAWIPGYKVALQDTATKQVVQVLTIKEVNDDEVVFEEDLTVSVGAAVKNSAGFVVSGHVLQYANYRELLETQRTKYASFGLPTSNYPSSRTQELEEQRAGTHNFVYDDGLPYILYPIGFTSSL